MNIDDLIKILQGSIAPTVLISGTGLLLLSITNRLARSIDRIRELCGDIKRRHGEKHTETFKQIDILYRRCQFLQVAIVFVTACITCVSLIILALFSMFIFRVSLIYLIRFLFGLGIISLILSLIFFLRDIFWALHSIKIEVEITKSDNG